MECAWLLRPPLNEDEATSYDTVNKYWDYALGFEGAASDDGRTGDFKHFPNAQILQPADALLLIGGRKSLGKGLSAVAAQGAIVQLSAGAGIGLFVSSAGGAVTTSRKKISGLAMAGTAMLSDAFHGYNPLRTRTDRYMHETRRYTLVQLFACLATINRDDLINHWNNNSVTVNQIYNVLINNELIKP